MSEAKTTVTVCDKCLRACCWKGIFMCDDARGAGTIERTVEECIALGLTTLADLSRHLPDVLSEAIEAAEALGL